MRSQPVLLALYREFNKGELADYHGPLVVSPLVARYKAEKEQIALVLAQRYGVNTPEGMSW